jgi:hypothetical protein
LAGRVGPISRHAAHKLKAMYSSLWALGAKLPGRVGLISRHAAHKLKAMYSSLWALGAKLPGRVGLISRHAAPLLLVKLCIGGFLTGYTIWQLGTIFSSRSPLLAPGIFIVFQSPDNCTMRGWSQVSLDDKGKVTQTFTFSPNDARCDEVRILVAAPKAAKISAAYENPEGAFITVPRRLSEHATVCTDDPSVRHLHECWDFLAPVKVPVPLPFRNFGLRYRVEATPGIAYRTYTKAMLDIGSPYDLSYITLDNRFEMDRSNIDIASARFVGEAIQHNVKEQPVKNVSNILQVLLTDLKRTEDKDSIILVLGALLGTGITLLTDSLIALVNRAIRSRIGDTQRHPLEEV